LRLEHDRELLPRVDRPRQPKSGDEAVVPRDDLSQRLPEEVADDGDSIASRDRIPQLDLAPDDSAGRSLQLFPDDILYAIREIRLSRQQA
jgi:hypothetical protein